MAAIGIAATAGGIAALYFAVVFATGRFATPHAEYAVMRTVPGARPFELRRYEPHHVAETRVAATELRAAGTQGFRSLAGYIFGGTADHSKIAMTTPVAFERAGGEGGHFVRFFLPSSLTSPPAPLDSRVVVRAVHASTLAVRALPSSFERLNSARFRDATDELAADATAAGLTVEGGGLQFSYDPPWTPWFLQRNEVALEVRETAAYQAPAQ